jgi:hypothetical protein
MKEISIFIPEDDLFIIIIILGLNALTFILTYKIIKNKYEGRLKLMKIKIKAISNLSFLKGASTALKEQVDIKFKRIPKEGYSTEEFNQIAEKETEEIIKELM